MMVLTRHEDWMPRLLAHVDQAHAAPFEWGRHDCCLFAADAVEAITGTDPAASLRGKYRSEQGAAKLILAHGGFEKMIESLCASHGMDEVRPLLARRGDLLLVDTPRGEALGVCLGNTIACAAPDGLAWLMLTAARRAWRVG